MKYAKILALSLVVGLLATVAYTFYPEVHGLFAAGEPDAQKNMESITLYDAGDITTNLQDSGDGLARYVQTRVVLACPDEDTVASLEELQPVIRNELLAIFRSLKSDDLRGKRGMSEVRGMILKTVNEVIEPAEIVDVYLTELIIQ